MSQKSSHGPTSKAADSERDAVQDLERIARQGIAAIKEKDRSKGSSMSSVATTAVQFVNLHVKRSKGVIRHARHGHESVHGTEEEKKERWKKMQTEVNRLRKAHPDWTWEAIKKRTAHNMGCSAKTIQRHCRDPRKKLRTVTALS